MAGKSIVSRSDKMPLNIFDSTSSDTTKSPFYKSKINYHLKIQVILFTNCEDMLIIVCTTNMFCGLHDAHNEAKDSNKSISASVTWTGCSSTNNSR